MRRTPAWQKLWVGALFWFLSLCPALLCRVAEAAQPVALTSGSANFGTQNVGVASTATLTFTFSQSASIVSPFVVTQGAGGQDFQSSGGTCATGTWNAGQSCTLMVTFTPLYPGLRMGAVVFAGVGAVIATAYLQGVGSGPMPTLTAGATIISPPLVPVTAVVDAAGTLYLGGQANVNGYQVRGIFQADGTDIGDGFSGEDAMAIDGSGRIYVSDHASNCVWTTTPAFPYIPSTTTCWTPPAGVAVSGPLSVDGGGYLYIGDWNSGSVLRFSPDGQQVPLAASCGSGDCVLTGHGLAVDGTGNVYLATTRGGQCFFMGGPTVGYDIACNGAVWKVPPGAALDRTQWTQIWQGTGGGYFSTRQALSLAVDGAGTGYILDNAKRLWKVPQGGNAALVDINGLGLSNWSPWYLTVDGPGNAYVTDSSNLKVYKLTGINSINVIATTSGVCGSANDQTATAPPATNLCAVGTASTITGTGPWAWTCLGLNGGAAASCSTRIPAAPVNGSCGSANGGSFTAPPATNLCSAGNPSPTPVDGPGPWTWMCGGINGGSNSPVCTANVSTGPVNGVCSSANGQPFTAAPGNLCAVGTPSSTSGPNAGPWAWTCAGLHGGSAAHCSTAAATCGTGTSTVISQSGVMGIAVDAADNVYYSYYNGGYQGIGYIPGTPVVVSPAYELGPFTAFGNGGIYYTVDTTIRTPPNQMLGCQGGYSALAADNAGRLYAAQSSRILVPGCVGGAAGNDTLIAGGGGGCAAQTDIFGDGCPATKATLSNVGALALDRANNIYFTDANGMNIRKIDAATGVVSFVMNHPCDTTSTGSIAVDNAGFLYFTDGGHVNRIDTVAAESAPGSMSVWSAACKTLPIPSVTHPVGVAVDSRGNLYVADSNVGVIKVAGVGGGSCGAAPVNAYCGGSAYFASSAPTQDLCDPGIASPVAGSSPGPWKWICSGMNSGSSMSCGTYPAQLTVTAVGSMVQGGTPAYTPIFSGWINGDTFSDVLSGSPAYSTTAAATSPPGTYPLTVSQGTLNGSGYYTFTFVPGTLSVVAAPGVQLSMKTSLTLQATGYQATVTITNNGGTDAAGVVVTTATLGSAAGSPLPFNVGTVKAGTSASLTITFPLSAGTGGQLVTARFAGTYTGGNFGSTGRVALPSSGD
jgi:hypothetical protein